MFKISFIFSIIIFSSFSQARQSCDWPFRTAINITETSGQNTSNYSVKLTLTGNSGGTLHSSYNWSSDGADLRLYSSNDSTPLEFSIESWSQSNKTAVIWVTLPSFNANSQHTVYVYYGNASVTTADSGTPPGIIYVDDQIKFHTRYNDRNANDPTSLSHAKALFDAQDDSTPGYGCSHPAEYQDIDNATQGGVNHDFIAVSEAYFTVPSSGQWGVRYGADYGLGGGLYVNGIALDERWNDDLWWGGSDWNNADVLQGLVNLSAGEHKLEVIGGEGCCDGGLTIQFYNGSTDTWGLASDPNVNIDIRSQACPVVRHTIQYGSHDVCGVDLSITSNVQSNEWFENSENNLTIQVNHQGSTPSGLSALANTEVSIQLPTEVTLIDSLYSGSNWACTGISGVISCLYNQVITNSGTSSTLTLHTDVGGSAGNSITISAQVTGHLPDPSSSNNTTSQTMSLLFNEGSPADCSNPKPGLWARYFDTTNYTPNDIVNKNSYQAMIDARMTAQYLFGQTILPEINGSGNPFDSSSNPDHFVLILQGYLYLQKKADYSFGVDGDDAIEAWVDDNIVSDFYGQHGAKGSAQNLSANIKLPAGFTPIEFRMQEHEGGDEHAFYWRKKGRGQNTVIIPSSAYYHCAGNPNIVLSTQVSVIQDDINGTNNPKAIPNAIMNINVSAINQGNISTDLNSTEIKQAIDTGTELYVYDFKGPGPINFMDGTNASNLSYQYVALNDGTDSISFSSDGSNFNHTATPDADGYDSAITHIRINFGGSFKAQMDGIQPAFGFEYQTRIK